MGGPGKVVDAPPIQPTRAPTADAPLAAKPSSIAPAKATAHAPDVGDVAKGIAYVKADGGKSTLKMGPPALADATRWKNDVAAAKTPSDLAALLSGNHFPNHPGTKKFIIDQIGEKKFAEAYDNTKGNGRARGDLVERWGPSLSAADQDHLAMHIAIKHPDEAAVTLAPLLQAAGAEWKMSGKDAAKKDLADAKLTAIVDGFAGAGRSVSELEGKVTGDGAQALMRYSRTQLGKVEHNETPQMVRESWNKLTVATQVELAQSLARHAATEHAHAS